MRLSLYRGGDGIMPSEFKSGLSISSGKACLLRHIRQAQSSMGEFHGNAAGLKRGLAIVSLALLTAVCSAAPLAPEFERPELGRTASGLIGFCNSTDPDRLAYCVGYIRGAAHLWKIQWACESTAREDQLFCAGVKAARTSIQEAMSTCDDCDQPD